MATINRQITLAARPAGFPKGSDFHLVYSPLPAWIQTLAIVFTLFLIAPSWGSVVNGYGTIGEDWGRMKTDYLAKFFILGITFYFLR